MTPYEEKPWLSSYNAGQPHTITPQFTDALSIFRAAADRAPARPAIHYFDATLSYAEVAASGSSWAISVRVTPRLRISALCSGKATPETGSTVIRRQIDHRRP